MLHKHLAFCILTGVILSGCSDSGSNRKETDLNGYWEIAVTTSKDEMPSVFNAKIPVPGLVDMASPAIDAQDTVYEDRVYWYKSTFSLKDPDYDIIQLKINKSCYHTYVFVNGNFAGENVCNFTPSLFDIRPFINKKGVDNELIIAVGCRNNLPDTVTNGWDFEKIKYIPGIYDDVKLIVSDFPFIRNIQVAPDAEKMQVRITAEIETRTEKRASVEYIIREVKSGVIVSQGGFRQPLDEDSPVTVVNMIIRMDSAVQWSPENPFMYDLTLVTSGDTKSTRFGMRSFRASPDSGIFLLNGKPRYLTGTNVCIYRFFEDPDRDDLPWDSEWVTKLHLKFREMGWTTIRYCIGFPPERWYDIADSLGFLIQDEYPLWTLGKENFRKYLGNLNSVQLAAEYKEWMRERWNHPCVVIWDAQNESITDTTGKAIMMVRGLDLSNRPWDNGWAAPVSETDAIESHPYLFSRYQRQKPGREGYLKEIMGKPQIPGNDPNSHYPLPDGKRYNNPIILNEYGWIWLNRDGSTTTLTQKVYENVFPEADTPRERLETYAKNLAILTEYWRSSRYAAAVMHFCGLGYSRAESPRGQTSDHFIDLRNLTFEPDFYNYMKQAFSPVAVMTEFWEQSVKRNTEIIIPVHIINDTYEVYSGKADISLYRQDNKIWSDAGKITVPPMGKRIIGFRVPMPADPGKMKLVASITYRSQQVQSIREFRID